jgi:hypothetical protein
MYTWTPTSTPSAELSTTSAPATPTPVELQSGTTPVNSSELTPESSPVLKAGSSSSNANAGVALASHTLLFTALSGVAVTVLMF